MKKLGKKLFKGIQGLQGQAFISDRVEEMSDDDVLDLAIKAYHSSRSVTSHLRNFITSNTCGMTGKAHVFKKGVCINCKGQEH